MARLHIMVGIPGSGKSTYAERLDGVVVSTDEIRKSLYGGESVLYSADVADYLIKKHNINTSRIDKRALFELKQALCDSYIFELAREKSRKLLNHGESVVYDSTNYKRIYRKEIMSDCKGCFEHCIAHYFDVPLRYALCNNKRRIRHEPEYIIVDMFNKMEPPSYSEGFHTIYLVDQRFHTIIMDS